MLVSEAIDKVVPSLVGGAQASIKVLRPPPSVFFSSTTSSPLLTHIHSVFIAQYPPPPTQPTPESPRAIAQIVTTFSNLLNSYVTQPPTPSTQ